MNIDKLKEEFAGKTNHEAYDLAFIKRLLRPHPTEQGAYLGNTQREEFIPLLKNLFKQLPENPQIFDIGAGGGEIIETALCDVTGATINLVEPNPVLLGKYLERLRRYRTLREGTSYCGLLQDFYPTSGMQPPAPSESQDLVLAIHMLYHLTDPGNKQFDPDADIEEAIATMFPYLSPGGSLFVVFANQLISTTGRAGRYYFKEIGKSEIADRLYKIAESRERLLGQGEIIGMLNDRFGIDSASVESFVTPSCFYGDSEEDIAAMCITAEIGEINNEPFDLNKLDVCGRFVETHASEIGLTREIREIAQKGMMRSNQPQIVSVIRKRGS